MLWWRGRQDDLSLLQHQPHPAELGDVDERVAVHHQLGGRARGDAAEVRVAAEGLPGVQSAPATICSRAAQRTPSGR